MVNAATSDQKRLLRRELSSLVYIRSLRSCRPGLLGGIPPILFPMPLRNWRRSQHPFLPPTTCSIGRATRPYSSSCTLSLLSLKCLFMEIVGCKMQSCPRGGSSSLIGKVQDAVLP